MPLGTVLLAFEPPDRLVFSSGTSDRPNRSPEHASEVEIRFIPEVPTTRAWNYEHRHLDRHGPGWESVHEGMDGDQGWPLYLSRYADLLEAS